MLDSTIQIRVSSQKKEEIKKNSLLLSKKLGIYVSITDYLLYLNSHFLDFNKEQS